MIYKNMVLGCLLSCLGISSSFAMQLDENCSVNILNRTVQVSSNGAWAMPNVPSFMGRVRARATCVRDGVTTAGQSNFFTVTTKTLQARCFGRPIVDELMGGPIVPTEELCEEDRNNCYDDQC